MQFWYFKNIFFLCFGALRYCPDACRERSQTTITIGRPYVSRRFLRQRRAYYMLVDRLRTVFYGKRQTSAFHWFCLRLWNKSITCIYRTISHLHSQSETAQTLSREMANSKTANAGFFAVRGKKQTWCLHSLYCQNTQTECSNICFWTVTITSLNYN